ncbi:hypothetical protein BH18ACT5_BH18ACT5_16160 [soil metagenome]
MIVYRPLSCLSSFVSRPDGPAGVSRGIHCGPVDSKVTPVEAPDMGATNLASPFEEGLARGYQALATGDCVAARDAFAIASVSDSPEALDGLGRALSGS